MDKQSLEIRTRQWYEIILEANSSSLSKKEWCIKKAGLPHQEKPATEVTDFSVNLMLNQSPSPPQQYSRSKDQDGAKDREEPCTGAAGGWKFVASLRCVDDLLPICCFWHITTCKYKAISL